MWVSTKKTLREKHNVKIILTGINVNSSDKHDLVYFSRCSSKTCTDSCNGETAWRLGEYIVDHACRDTESYIIKHCLNSSWDN